MLGRRYGFASDHVRALELVTADGELRCATAEEHPELFWAVRGGKGNFGVVTSVETDLMPVDRLYGGGLFFPGAATREVLGGWLEWTASQPEEMASSSLALQRFPDMPGVPDPVRGKFMVHVRVAYTGQPEEGERLLRPLRSLGPVMDSVSDMPYTSIGDVHNDPTGPAPVRDRGILLRELDGEAVERIAALAGPGTELPPGQVEIRHLGGALGRMPETPNAISHRDAAFGMNLGMLVPPGHEKRVDGIQQALIDELRPWDTGRNAAQLPRQRRHPTTPGASRLQRRRLREAGCHQDDPRPAQSVSGQPQYPTATEPWKSSLVNQWRHETRTTLVRPFTCSSLLTVRVRGGLIVPPGQVRNHLQLRLLYRPTVAGDQENTAKISTPRF